MIRVQDYDRLIHLRSWNNLASTGMNSDFMFIREYIEYKKDLKDCSLIVFDDDIPIAIIPLGENGSPTKLKSHPRTSYGGLVFDKKYGGKKLSEVTQAIVVHLRNKGYKELILSLKPEFYSHPFASEEFYHWVKVGGQIERVRIGNVLLTSKNVLANRRKRSLKKSSPDKFIFEYGPNNMQKVFEIAALNLLEIHGIKPTHNFDELTYLQDKFPSRIITASMRTKLGEEIVAGIILFENGNSSIVQYWGMKPEYRSQNIIDHLILDVIEKMKVSGKDFFVFGISTSGDDDAINQGIYEYKSSFGAGTYTALDLRISL